jgi:hypothetical protein
LPRKGAVTNAIVAVNPPTPDMEWEAGTFQLMVLRLRPRSKVNSAPAKRIGAMLRVTVENVKDFAMFPGIRMLHTFMRTISG